MTVKVTKPAINVREELADLRKPTGIAGEAMLRAETPQEQFNLIGAGRRNLIINGAMQVAQRGTSFTANGYGLDRWSVDTYGSGTSKTVTQDSDAPYGFSKSLKYVNGGVDESAYYFIQKIERENFERLSGQAVTFSFYIKGSQALAGVPWYVTVNGDGTGNDEVNTGTYNITTSWQRVTFTVTLGDFSGYTITDSGFMEFLPIISAGSYPNIPANMSIWVTGIQLEIGKVATPFEHRSYGEELALCQRYYTKWTIPTQWAGYQNATTLIDFSVYTPVPLRNGSPSLSCTGSFYKWSHEGYQVQTSPNISISGGSQDQFSNNSIMCTVDGFSGGDNGYVANVYISNLEIDDEL